MPKRVQERGLTPYFGYNILTYKILCIFEYSKTAVWVSFLNIFCTQRFFHNGVFDKKQRLFQVFGDSLNPLIRIRLFSLVRIEKYMRAVHCLTSCIFVFSPYS